MESNEKQSLYERVQKRLSLFFPDMVYTRESVDESLEVGDIFYKSTDVLPFLQSALFDEKVVEVELDGMSRVYFSRVYDDVPDLVQTEVDGEIVMSEPNYKPGSYLKNMTHVISLPLEPGIGNLNIRSTRRILLRMFTTSYAVELGTSFQDITEVRELPVLRLAFPIIGRLVRGAREFRAKVPEKLDMKVLIVGKRKQDSVNTRIVDISVSGMSFSIKKNQQDFFKPDETRTLEFIIDGMMVVRLNGNIRHVSKVRGKKGTEYVCGVKFDLITRALASKIEGIVASVQRAHLKELYDKSVASGLDLIA
jgi:PilZ domain